MLMTACQDGDVLEKNESDKVAMIGMITNIPQLKHELGTDGNSPCLPEHNS